MRTARTSNIKEPQQTYRLRTVSIKILEGLNRFYGKPISPSASIMAQNIQLFSPCEGFLAHKWIITGSKYDDETKMRTRQKRVAIKHPSKCVHFMHPPICINSMHSDVSERICFVSPYAL